MFEHLLLKGSGAASKGIFEAAQLHRPKLDGLVVRGLLEGEAGATLRLGNWSSGTSSCRSGSVNLWLQLSDDHAATPGESQRYFSLFLA
jgi:hypothetical protein